MQIGLNAGHKRMWYRRGVQDARQCIEPRIDTLLSVAVNYYKPKHFSDTRTYYMIGYRRTDRNRIKREYYQRAGICSS